MNINNIIIKKQRIRKNLGDLSSLKQSLEKHGLLYPIIITPKYQLIAGKRRLQAAKELGWEEIDVIIKDMNFSQAYSIELEENTTRKEFTNSELIEGLKTEHKLNTHNIFYKIFYYFQNIFRSLFK